jgi:hypothetical protein
MKLCLHLYLKYFHYCFLNSDRYFRCKNMKYMCMNILYIFICCVHSYMHVCIYVHTCLYVYLYIYVYIYICVYLLVHVHMHIYICITYVYTFKCMYINIHRKVLLVLNRPEIFEIFHHTYVYMYKHIHIHTYVCIYLCMYNHIYV